MTRPVTNPDGVLPSAPGVLVGSGGLGSASLSWGAASDNVGVVRYNVHRGTTAGFTPSLGNRVGQPAGTSFSDTGLAAGSYYYRVAAEDAAGNVGPFSNEAAATVGDTVAPSAPGTVSAVGSVGKATLSWAAASDNVGVLRYNVHRSTTAGFTPSAANRIAQPATPGYIDTTAPGSYFYKVTAEDAAGNIGPVSNEAAATVTADTTAPSAPSALAAPVTGATANLAWTGSTDDVAVLRYNVHRGSSAGFSPSAGNRIAQPTGTSHADGGLATGTYYYKVTAEDAAGNISAASNEATATVADATPPSAPGTLTATATASTINLGWGAATDNVAVSRYNLHRGTSSGFTPNSGNRIAQPTGLSHADNGLAPGTYFYKLTAEDARRQHRPAQQHRHRHRHRHHPAQQPHPQRQRRRRPNQPQLDRRHRQRRRHPLQPPPLHHKRLHPQHRQPDRPTHHHQLHRHRPHRRHLLLQAHRRRRRRQHQHRQQPSHRHRHHPTRHRPRRRLRLRHRHRHHHHRPIRHRQQRHPQQHHLGRQRQRQIRQRPHLQRHQRHRHHPRHRQPRPHHRHDPRSLGPTHQPRHGLAHRADEGAAGGSMSYALYAHGGDSGTMVPTGEFVQRRLPDRERNVPARRSTPGRTSRPRTTVRRCGSSSTASRPGSWRSAAAITTSTGPLRIGGNSDLGRVVPGRHRRSPHLQPRPHRHRDPGRHEHLDQRARTRSPPSAPGTLTATGGLGQVGLAWGAATDNVAVARYNVHRGTTAGFTPSCGEPDRAADRDELHRHRARGRHLLLPGHCRGRGRQRRPGGQRGEAAAAADTTPPTVSITAPASGATVSASVSVTASAADNGTVAGVQFRLDGVNLGAEDTSSPYSIAWDTFAAGNGAAHPHRSRTRRRRQHDDLRERRRDRAEHRLRRARRRLGVRRRERDDDRRPVRPRQQRHPRERRPG